MYDVRPGYSLSNRRRLELLDTVYDEYVEDVCICLNSKEASLVQGGWSTIHNQPVIATCLVAYGCESHFHNLTRIFDELYLKTRLKSFIIAQFQFSHLY